jgi:dimethylpropiothetin dethiomethylase
METTGQAGINEFLIAARERLSDSTFKPAKTLCQALHDLPQVPIEKPARYLPACSLFASVEVCRGDPLLRSFLRCRHQLPWRIPGFGKLPAALKQQLAVTEIVGPQGLFYSSSVRLGILLQLSHTAYPRHRHAADELYLVLHGHARWSVDDGGLKRKPPGTYIHHQPFVLHTIQTDEEPLVALWGWVGDIDGSTYTMGTAASVAGHSRKGN